MSIQCDNINVLKFHLFKKNIHMQSIFTWLSTSLVLFPVRKELMRLSCGINKKEREKKELPFVITNKSYSLPLTIASHFPN